MDGIQEIQRRFTDEIALARALGDVDGAETIRREAVEWADHVIDTLTEEAERLDAWEPE
jgi:hypothetical protein